MQISESCIGRALRTPQWTYCVQAPKGADLSQPDSSVYEETHLYYLPNDPYQKNNIVTDKAYTSVRESLRQRLLDYIKTIENKTPVIELADTL